MENFSHPYRADLVAFSEAQDLPPSLHIFAEIKANKEKRELKNDARVIVLRIRETTDCYSAIFIDGDRSVGGIERELSKDLKNLPIRLSYYARKKARELLCELNHNNFICYIDNEILHERNRYMYGETGI